MIIKISANFLQDLVQCQPGMDVAQGGAGLSTENGDVFWDIAIFVVSVIFHRIAWGNFSWKPLVLKPVVKTVEKLTRPLSSAVPSSETIKKPIPDYYIKPWKCPHRPLMIPPHGRHKQRMDAIISDLETKIKDCSKVLTLIRICNEMLQERLPNIIRFRDTFFRSRSRHAAAYRKLVEKTTSLIQEREDIFSSFYSKMEELEKENESLSLNHSRLQTLRNNLRKTVDGLMKGHLDDLIKSRNLTQEAIQQTHQLTQKLRVRGYLADELRAMIRRKEDICRRIQQETFNLKCYYVTEDEYKHKKEAITFPLKIALGLGIFNAIGLVACALLHWAPWMTTEPDFDFY